MFCSACGTQLHDHAIVCPKCGVPTSNYSKSPQNAQIEITQGTLVAAYAVGAIIPLIGWIIAVYLLVKGHVGHAIGVGALSMFMFFFWIAVMNG